MGRRKLFLTVSGILVFLSIATAIYPGPKWGIDFAGGTEIQIAFKRDVDSATVRQALADLGFPDAEVVTFGAQKAEYLIRLQAISSIGEALSASSAKSFKESFPGAQVKRFDFSPGGDKLTIGISKDIPIAEIEKAVAAAGLTLGSAEEKIAAAAQKAELNEEGEEIERAETNKNCEGVTCTWSHQNMRIYEVNLEGVSENVMKGLRARDFGKGAVKMRSEWIGPKVGKQLRTAGLASLGYSFLFIMIYVAVRFDIRFAPGGIIALIHDVAITFGVFTLTRIEVTLTTVAALLTIIGYSINDTIVIFDRIRENGDKVKEKDLFQLINVSINQTLSRTILTSLTVLLTVLVLLILGWKTTIRDFAFAMVVGTIVGSYSTVFIASPIVVWLDRIISRRKAA